MEDMEEKPTIKDSKTKDSKEESTLNIPKELQELLEAGVHFGHKKSSVHPGMFPYIFGVRNNTHIFDVEKVQEKLNEALKYIDQLAKEGKTILFVGTRVPIRPLVKELAISVKMPYITEYWAGGTLTNWNTIQDRITHMKDLQKLQKSSEWEKYTKHERLSKTRELKKLENRWGGIQHMEKLPDAIFVADMQEDIIAAKEARKISIPIIAIVDSNINPAGADYIIPANDDSISSVSFILGKVKNAIKGIKSAKKTSTKEKTKVVRKK